MPLGPLSPATAGPPAEAGQIPGVRLAGLDARQIDADGNDVEGIAEQVEPLAFGHHRGRQLNLALLGWHLGCLELPAQWLATQAIVLILKDSRQKIA